MKNIISEAATDLNLMSKTDMGYEKNSLGEDTLKTLAEKINKELIVEQQLIQTQFASSSLTMPKSNLTGDLKTDEKLLSLLKDDLMAASKDYQKRLLGNTAIKQIIDVLESPQFKKAINSGRSTLSGTLYGESISDKEGGAAKDIGMKTLQDGLTEVYQEVNQSGELNLASIKGKDIRKFFINVFKMSSSDFETINSINQEIFRDALAAGTQGLVFKGKSNQRFTSAESRIKKAYKDIFRVLQERAEQVGKAISDKDVLNGSFHFSSVDSNSRYAETITIQFSELAENGKKKRKKKSDINVRDLADSFWGLILEQSGKFKTAIDNDEVRQTFYDCFLKVFNYSDIKVLEVYSGAGITGVISELAVALTYAQNSNETVSMIGNSLLRDARQGNVDILFEAGGRQYGIQVKDYSKSSKNTLLLYDKTEFDIMDAAAERYFTKDFLYALRFLIVNYKAIMGFESGLVNYGEVTRALLSALPALVRQDLANDYDSNLTTNTLYVLNGEYFFSSYILVTIYEAVLAVFKKVSTTNDVIQITKFKGGNYSGEVQDDSDIIQYSTKGTSFVRIKTKADGWLPKNLEEAQSKARIVFKGIKIKLK